MNLPEPLLTVVRRLGSLRERVVFVGGMIRSLLVTDAGSMGARPTQDVDLIVEVPSLVEYLALSTELRSLGFREARSDSAPACRWTIDEVPVDIMPVDPLILGFTNAWYPGARGNALPIAFDQGAGTLWILDAAYFCATKLEAFAGRGKGDFHHHDLEDFIALVDGRATLVHELSGARSDLCAFIARQTVGLLAQPAFREALPGHLAPDAGSQARLPLVLSRLDAIGALVSGAEPTIAREQPVRPQLPTWPASATPTRSHTFLLSSNLSRAHYDPRTSTLTVEFVSGTRYAYEGVPEPVYAGLTLAASAGRYLNEWIKKRYRYRRISEAAGDGAAGDGPP